MAINHFNALKKKRGEKKNNNYISIQHLTIISTACGGGGLSQVAWGNEY